MTTLLESVPSVIVLLATLFIVSFDEVAGSDRNTAEYNGYLQTLATRIDNLEKTVTGLVNSNTWRKKLGCPLGYVTIGNFKACYKFEKSKLDWTDSVMECIKEGANLLYVDSKEEDNQIRLYIYTNKTLRGVGFDTSGNDLAKEGVFTWYPSERLMGNVGWAPSQPNGGKAQHCVNIYYDATNKRYGWSDYLCETKRGRICKIAM